MSVRFRSLVLCYHAVSATWPHLLAVDAPSLERQVRSLLRRGYRAVGTREAVEGRGRTLHVTFDDAFTSVATILPVLADLSVPVTVFACSGYADDGRPLDIPKLADDARRYPGELSTMRWDALRDLAERGVEIGSHTISHPHLPRLGDEELKRELRDSRARIEDELRRPCRYLAYPFGDENDRVHEAARDAGYDAAFALPGRERPINRHALPRVGIYRKDSLLRATLKTSFVRRVVAARRG